jgi:hypothetical protein
MPSPTKSASEHFPIADTQGFAVIRPSRCDIAGCVETFLRVLKSGGRGGGNDKKGSREKTWGECVYSRVISPSAPFLLKTSYLAIFQQVTSRALHFADTKRLACGQNDKIAISRFEI